MSKNGKIYTAGKNFTLPRAVTAWTNSTSDPNLLDIEKTYPLGPLVAASLFSVDIRSSKVHFVIKREIGKSCWPPHS